MEDDDFDIWNVAPRMGAVSLGLLPQVLERVAAGDPGEPQPSEGATWAGHFGVDYVAVDWTQPARRIHDQVRAWQFTFSLTPLAGPIAEMDGRRVRLTRTSLVDPGGEARRVDAGDGPIWIVRLGNRSNRPRRAKRPLQPRRPGRAPRRTSGAAGRRTTNEAWPASVSTSKVMRGPRSAG